ncbi:pilus assembly protein PilP [Vreelandella olivaria]|uniref:pilus assembly protein PilP n=1 Tax=Vreelandella olivaria TaxID=390919 RepID=UPI00201EB9B4|nr:pilus assembly protein PilP [Halomonas olivaria]
MKRIAAVCSSVVLLGCSDTNLEQLDATLAEIRRAPGGKAPMMIAPLPDPQSLDYQYGGMRSPFLAPDSVPGNEIQGPQETSLLAPDQQRMPEPLEHFQLQSLRLVGTLSMGGQRVALIASPDGNVSSVREGNYLGSNYGQIIRITPQEITIVERILSQQQGWQERQAALSIGE